ncbi:MAG: acyl-CoA thioesterase [Balneolaceae bacterium]
MIKPPFNEGTFPNWTTIQIRYRDLDTLNHVNNAQFNTYFEEARIRFISEIPEFLSSMKSGNSFVLVHLEINYINPLLYPSDILVGTGVADYGNSSISGFQAIYESKSKELKAVAKSTGVWYSTKSQRPVRLPELPDKNLYLIKNLSD